MIKLPIDLKDNKPQTLIFLLLVAAIIFLLYFNLLLLPQLKRTADVWGKADKMKKDLVAAGLSVSSIPSYKKDIASYQDKVDRYEKMLPAEQEIPNLLENLSDMARSSNVKILGITPVKTASIKQDKPGKNQVYQEIPILISAKSGYHELGSFLSKLENSDRFMKVVDIEIKANKAMPKKHDIELIVCTYTLKR